jgi:hypothetical protein
MAAHEISAKLASDSQNDLSGDAEVVAEFQQGFVNMEKDWMHAGSGEGDRSGIGNLACLSRYVMQKQSAMEGSGSAFSYADCLSCVTTINGLPVDRNLLLPGAGRNTNLHPGIPGGQLLPQIAQRIAGAAALSNPHITASLLPRSTYSANYSILDESLNKMLENEKRDRMLENENDKRDRLLENEKRDRELERKDLEQKLRNSVSILQTNKPRSLNGNGHAVSVLKNWLFSDSHFCNPYPTAKQKDELALKAGISVMQVCNWFANSRKRVWQRSVTEMGMQVCVHDYGRLYVKKLLREEGEPLPCPNYPNCQVGVDGGVVVVVHTHSGLRRCSVARNGKRAWSDGKYPLYVSGHGKRACLLSDV